jgi:hypothetical protein
MTADPLTSLHDDLGVLAVALTQWEGRDTAAARRAAGGPAGPGQTRLAGMPCHPPAGRARHIIRGRNTP